MGYKFVQGNLELYNAEDLGDWKEGLPGILRGIFNSGSYMMNLEKMRKEQLHSMNELKNGQAGYFYLWHVYAIMTNTILEKIGF